MQTILLSELDIINFKGISKLQIKFNPEGETNILGANGSGKSSIFDAFMWLLFGKDSQDRKDFDIKNTVDTDLNRQDHEVSAILKIDGRKETVKRVFREKWVKRQGSELREYQGNETVFFWNEVPMQAGEFKTKVESIMQENIFKLLTNALYFNQMKWTERRKILEDIAGPVTWEDIDTEGRFKALLDELENKSLEDYKKVIAAKKKTIKESLVEISPRIEENLRSMITELDFSVIALELKEVNRLLAKAEAALLDSSKAQQAGLDSLQKQQKALHEAKTALYQHEFKIKQEIAEEQQAVKSSISTLKARVEDIESSIKSKQTLVAGKKEVNKMLDEQNAELRTRWAVVKARELVYDEREFTCPTCNRDFETDNIEEAKRVMEDNFKEHIDRERESINQQGKNNAREIANNTELIANLELVLVDLGKDLIEATKSLRAATEPLQPIGEVYTYRVASHKEILALREQIAALEENQIAKPEMDTAEEIKSEKAKLIVQADELKRKLAIKDQIAAAQKRVDELKDQEKLLAQELAELEGREFEILEFTKARMDAIENRIDQKFEHVTFNMFNTLINGGTEETCETLYKGVPFDSLNTAGKLTAGLDIINTLSAHYGYAAPIFVDNRESVTHTIPVKAQLINLIVSAKNETILVT